MFDYLKKIFAETEQSSKKETNKQKKIQIATCALFVELAKADNDFSDEERGKIISIMKDFFSLEEEYVEELIELSENRVNQSVSVYEFTSIINGNFSKEEKYELLINLWRLVYVDDNLDKYEDGLMRKLGTLLNLEHSDLISAKLSAKQEKKN